MITQVTAAALASENKTLAHPASADSIPTSANKEDFVCMGMWAVLKFRRAVENVAQIVAIELLASAQGVEFHRPLKPGVAIERGLRRLRRRASRTRRDEPLSDKMRIVRDLVLSGFFGGLA
ncbi:MAG: aromatic amino acid lyase [Elusimicrobiota bacterium]